MRVAQLHPLHGCELELQLLTKKVTPDKADQQEEDYLDDSTAATRELFPICQKIVRPKYKREDKIISF
jgi:hypothetical protein